MTSQQPDVMVIGAGVSGLSTAVCLAEAGCDVTVAAAQRAPLITSAAAGAIWGPHLVGIDERVTRWGAVTLAHLSELADDRPAACTWPAALPRRPTGRPRRSTGPRARSARVILPSCRPGTPSDGG